MVPSGALLNDNTKIIYESRALLGLLSFGGIVLAFGGLLMFGATIGLFLGLLGPMKPADAPYIAFGMLLAIAGVVLFGVGSCQMVQRLFGAPEPVVFLADDGFKDIRVSTEWIPWPKILSVKDPRGGNGSRGFSVEIDPEFATPLAMSLMSRLTLLGSRLFGDRGVWIMTATLKGVSGRELFDEMRGRLDPSTTASVSEP
jgi:hypothetical protein